MSITERQIFEPDGRAIPYVDEGTGPALLLLPARGLDITYLGTLASVLVEEDFRVVQVGARRPGADALTMHDLAQDVVDVMDHLGVEHAWIGGHAFGGAVARTVALDHHDRANGVLLLGVDAGETESLSGSAPDHEFLARARDTAIDAVQAAALAATPEPEWAAIAPGLPALIIQGTDDRITPAAGGRRLQASAADRATLVDIDGGGHLFVSTHAGHTAAVIEDYLDWD
ncbi:MULTISPECIES: alpha/beta fold hydrolase [Microbacterium]|uniref:Pimeloyl-ACP methyl ester carboxylesterase n=1 Tax=Microbacterium saccharophilum TaxID=1213358 RepID=A0A7Z7D1T2_9MICO|nr:MULTISPECIES: alpha/beta hydrolase [Microbacterium]SFI77465.1 Pimeloyl-ACP methyl ester carboxylesterase [Microbacterium saccharophilum]